MTKYLIMAFILSVWLLKGHLYWDNLLKRPTFAVYTFTYSSQESVSSHHASFLSACILSVGRIVNKTMSPLSTLPARTHEQTISKSWRNCTKPSVVPLSLRRLASASLRHDQDLSSLDRYPTKPVSLKEKKKTNNFHRALVCYSFLSS